MRPAAIVAIGAVSPLGSGRDAYAVGPAGRRPVTAIAEDPALVQAGLRRPFLARARLEGPDGQDRAAALLATAARGLVGELERVLPRFRELRLGVVVGTSSGGMLPLTQALSLLARGEGVPAELARAAPYFGPLSALDDVLGVAPVARVQVLAACASSAVALGLGARWLELGVADLVVAGGYDAVSVFVAAGFECIGATSATRPNPFRVERDGMALGEGAALLALVPPGVAASRAWLRGFGATCDAVHVTAPDRTGDGLARAALAALADAGLPGGAVDVVSAHATATPFNDAAEALALSSALGPEARPVVHPFKAVIGHTLGASAALELAAAVDALSTGVLPAAPGDGAALPGLTARLLAANEAGEPRVALKLSAAFAGGNAALVASATPGPVATPMDGVTARPCGAVVLAAVGRARRAGDLAAAGATALSPTHASRLDPLSAACVAATAEVLRDREGLPPLERVGVVVGSAASVLENDDAFDRRVREQGARAAEPRRFPATSPNVPAGQCAIAFGLKGPVFAVGAGPEAPFEAMLVAWDLLASGDADAIVVVAAEDAGPAVSALWAAAGRPVPESGAAAALLLRGEPGLRSDGPSPSGVAGVRLGREPLASLWRRSREEQGGLGPAGPGWPAFLAGLETLA